MTDQEKLAMIRAAMPVTETTTYLNTGTCGPIPQVGQDALAAAAARDFTEGRASMAGFMKAGENKVAAREHIAALTHTRPENIALTHHTTEGMNIVLHGFNWQPGDEIVTTTLEHEGGLLPIYVLRQRYGVTLKMVELDADDTPESMLNKLEAAIGPRTRLMLFSHVAWNTGARLPLEAIVAMGHRHHVLSLVDAAQSAGSIPLDLPASGVDFYAMPGQKWLCGPEGTGALYVRPDRLSLLNPTFVGFTSMENVSMWDFSGYFMPAQGARRFEVGSVYRPGIAAMAATQAWLADDLGWEWIYARIAHMQAYARQAIGQLEGVTLLTPPGPQAGLLSFTLSGGYDPAAIVRHLAEQDIIIRFLRHPYCLRVSTGFYNNEADIDRLVAALQHVHTLDPETLT